MNLSLRRLGIWPVLAGTIALGVGITAGVSSARTQLNHVPNARKIVLFTVDTLRADRLGCYGYQDAPTTPALDTWSRDAVLFERAYAPAPWTVPSLAALFTGRYPIETGAFTNETGIGEGFRTLPELLREAGYITASFNSHAVLLEPEMGFRRGFDQVSPENYEVVLEGEHKIAFSTVEPDLMRWLDENADKDFFLWIHDMDPHHPETPGNPYLEDPSWTTYQAEIRGMDEAFARVVRRLQALGVWDDVLFIFTADHGEAFDEHGLVGHQNVMYDEVLRIPLLINYPRAFAGSRVRDLADLLDVRATILDMARITPPERERGESLVDLLRGSPLRQHRENLFHSRYFFEDGRHELAVRDRWWKLLARTPPGEDRLGETLPTGTLDSESWTLELFNLSTDPLERENLTAEYPVVVRKLTSAIEDWDNSNDVPIDPAPRLDESDLEMLRNLGYRTADGLRSGQLRPGPRIDDATAPNSAPDSSSEPTRLQRLTNLRVDRTVRTVVPNRIEIVTPPE